MVSLVFLTFWPHTVISNSEKLTRPTVHPPNLGVGQNFAFLLQTQEGETGPLRPLNLCPILQVYNYYW